ncbi:MAG: hypothetical protein Q8L48_28015 [Archangium sp.]|nr:hypothetical protein [Archangium sp.]
MKTPVLAAALLALTGCHRVTGPPGVESLVGLTLPLASSPALRLVVEGAVQEFEAEISFDPSQPVSFVTSKCVPSPAFIARVSVPDAFGPDETFPLTRVVGLRLGDVRFRTFEAAVASGKSCVVVLGAPDLKDVALEVSPVARTVHFRPTQTREQWVAEAEKSGDDAQVLAFTKDPRFDWPLLPIRVRQGPTSYDSTMLFSLREPRSRIFDDWARALGLRPGLELLEGLALPEGLELPPELSQLRGYAWDTLEFAPGFGLSFGSLEVEPGAPPHAVHGLIGADTWSRFFMTYDVGSSVLVLRRPRVFVSGNQARCERGGVVTEEACFELRSTPTADGVDVTAAVWRPLPSGAQLSLDLVGGAGTCRLGLTFSPGDRGRSTHHHFPWKKLGDSIPACGEAFKGVTQVNLGLLEESPLQECPGVCAYARDALTGRMSCECQPGVRTADGDAEKRLLELFKKLLEEKRPPREVEPKDPD